MHIQRNIQNTYPIFSEFASIANKKPPFFEQACEAGRYSDSNYRMGAVIWNKNRLVCIGWNQLTKTHPLQAKFKNREQRIYLHAEIHAIVKSRQNIEGMSITIGRAHKYGSRLGSSRPCSGCLEAIKWAGIKKFCYFHDDQFITELC